MSAEVTQTINDINAAPPRERARLIDAAANQTAARHFDLLRGSPDWKPQPPQHIPALASAAICMMVKDEGDIIVQSLTHHYNLGFRRFFILDNNSTDATPALIADFRTRYQDAGVFCASDYIVGHYQAVKMNALARFVETYLQYEEQKLEWLFFIDTDELITCAGPDPVASAAQLGAMLSNPTFNLIYFHWAQCASRTLLRSLQGQQDLFEAFPVVWPKMKVTVPKVAIRAGSALQVIQGNHGVESFPYPAQTAALAAAAGFYMFHFPNRSVEQLRRKLVNGNLALKSSAQDAGIQNTAGHWRTYHEWYLKHGDAALEGILREHITGCLEPVGG